MNFSDNFREIEFLEGNTENMTEEIWMTNFWIEQLTGRFKDQVRIFQLEDTLDYVNLVLIWANITMWIFLFLYLVVVCFRCCRNNKKVAKNKVSPVNEPESKDCTV